MEIIYFLISIVNTIEKKELSDKRPHGCAASENREWNYLFSNSFFTKTYSLVRSTSVNPHFITYLSCLVQLQYMGHFTPRTTMVTDTLVSHCLLP